MENELLRQLVHLSGLLFVLIAQFLGRIWSVAMFLAIAMYFLLYYEYVKRSKSLIGFRKIVFFFETRSKGRPFSGAFWFYAGSTLSFIFFPLNIASASVAILAVGDSFSTIFGVRFGGHKLIGKKSLEGSLAFLMGSFLISLFFVNPLPGFIGSFTAMVVELFTPPKMGRKSHWIVDDNLLIPIISGAVIFLLGFIL